MKQTMNYTFEDMKHWDIKQLRKVRKSLRDKLSEEINKRDALKAEILHLHKTIEQYTDD